MNRPTISSLFAAASILLAGTLLAAPAEAQTCRAGCGECVQPWAGGPSDCTARNLCRLKCDAKDKLDEWRTKALTRLEADKAKAVEKIQEEITTKRTAANTKADEALAAYRERLNAARTQVRRSATSALDRLRAVQQDIESDFVPRLEAAGSCFAAPLPPFVQQAYSDARSQGQQWLSQADQARATAWSGIDDGRAQADATAVTLFAVPGQTLANLTSPVDNVTSEAAGLRTEIRAATDDPVGFLDTLKNYANNGFQTLSDLRSTGIGTVQTTAETVLAQIETLHQDSAQRAQQAQEQWLAAANTVVAGVPRFNMARDVAAMRDLRNRMRLDVPAWPKLMSCLCRSVNVPPQDASTDGVGQVAQGSSNHLEILTDAMCASSALIGTVARAPQKLAQLRVMRTQTPPIDTRYDPAAALSDEGRAALRTTADTYETWAEQTHIYGHIVIDCVEAGVTDRKRVGACGSNEDMSNSGGSTGKLLAARAYKYGLLATAKDPRAAQALVKLEETLAGMHNIMTIARGGPDGKITEFNGQATGDLKDGIPGLPVRGYVDANLRNNEAFHITRANPDGSLADPGGAKMFYAERTTLLGLPGEVEYRFKERESGDDTFATLLGLTAAYDVLKEHGVSPEWRKRIVGAVEAFGEYYVRSDKRYQIRTPRNGDTWSGDASDQTEPLHLLQNLSWLKAIIHISSDFRGNSSGIVNVETAYRELVVGQLGADVLTHKGLVGMGLLLSSPARLALREPIAYFYKAYNIDYWVMSTYLLVKYEKDPVLGAIYQDVYRRVIAPLVVEYRVPMHDFAALVVLPEKVDFATATGVSRNEATGRAAAALRQYRSTVPAPFGNPMPDSNDPANTGFYYSNFTTRDNLKDPLYFHLKAAWSRLSREHPHLWRYLVATASIDEMFGDDQGSAWPLGQGLVPKGSNSGPYALAGGHWDAAQKQIDVFGRDEVVTIQVPEIGLNGLTMVEREVSRSKTVKAQSSVEFLFGYWFGRFHGALKD